MNDKFFELNDESTVVNLTENYDTVVAAHPMLKNECLLQKAKLNVLSMSKDDWNRKVDHWAVRKKWVNEGIECEILKLGSNSWQKGKVRIKVTVEFCPDELEIQEPDSPLDDIRQTMNQVE